MSTFAPEFSQYWMAGGSAHDEARAEPQNEDMRNQQAALEELAERVNAARSVI